MAKTNEAKPEERWPDAEIADAIMRISDAFERINKGPLKREAIVTLLRDSTGVSKDNIRRVLNGLDDLRKVYLK